MTSEHDSPKRNKMEFHLGPTEPFTSPYDQPLPQNQVRLPSISHLLSYYPMQNSTSTRAFSKWSHEQTAQLVDYFRRPGVFVHFQNSKKNDFYASIVKQNIIPGKDARQIKNKFEHLTRKYEEMDSYLSSTELTDTQREAYVTTWPFYVMMREFMQLDDKRHKRKRSEDPLQDLKKQRPETPLAS
jgi:hypothetical protein